jgi:protein TonB
MTAREQAPADVYTAADIAAAAGVPEPYVRGLVARGEIRSVTAAVDEADARWADLVAHAEAVKAVRTLRSWRAAEATTAAVGLHDSLLLPAIERPRQTTVPLLMSTSLHLAVAAAALVIASLDFARADERTDPIDVPTEPARLVFLAQPGPGGGGGGGGLRMRTPPPKAEREGRREISSPIPARRLPPPPEPPPLKPEPPPPPLEAKTLPPVMAPVVTMAADTKNQEGLLKEVPKETRPSAGAGSGGGTGSGQGTGLGEGSGSGIGPGEGGGTGGGPYRPGSGVDPPRLLREVRADYTDAARRANLNGEVLLEIVVRRDGTVGDIRVLQRLGSGLDERAIHAVRQWRFAPARLKGTPVDVIVEVSVEFKLR